MGSSSDIQWTDATWNPVAGCSRVSPGCDNCYAMRFAHRFSGPGGRYEGLTRIGKRGVDWSGVVRLTPSQVELPLSWRKAKRIFVNSMSDLFHPGLSDDARDEAFAVMGACDDRDLGHAFQVLTKRIDVAFGYLCSERARKAWNSRRMNRSAWPARNVWLGVSAEDQERADERIPLLLRTPAAVRFVSAEPLIGPVDLRPYLIRRVSGAPTLDWVIVGGESGQRARPFHVEWARQIVDECRKHLVACFVKQLGAKPYREGGEDETLWGDTVRGRECDALDEPAPVRLEDRKGGDWSEWPIDLRVREFPTAKGASA